MTRDIVFGASDVQLVPEHELATASDLMVAVGGDGTMLHTARMAASAGAPDHGINRGRHGFLADDGPGRMLERIETLSFFPDK